MRQSGKAICISIGLPITVQYLKVVHTQSSYPSLASGIKLCRCQHICEWIVICIHSELIPVKVIVELLSYGPFQSKKFQLVSGVVFLGFV